MRLGFAAKRFWRRLFAEFYSGELRAAWIRILAQQLNVLGVLCKSVTSGTEKTRRMAGAILFLAWIQQFGAAFQ